MIDLEVDMNFVAFLPAFGNGIARDTVVELADARQRVEEAPFFWPSRPSHLRLAFSITCTIKRSYNVGAKKVDREHVKRVE